MSKNLKKNEQNEKKSEGVVVKLDKFIKKTFDFRPKYKLYPFCENL